MKQQIKTMNERGDVLEIALQDENAMDPDLIAAIRHDDYCLDPIDNANGTLAYRYGKKVPVAHFLKHYVFESGEGYDFLIELLEKAIAVNRSKPVLLDLDWIYIERDGTGLAFVVVPLKLDYWLYRKEDCLAFVRALAATFQTAHDYEVTGYLHALLHSEEFSIPNLVLGLKALRRQYHPKKWYDRWSKKRSDGFLAREEVGGYFVEPAPVLRREDKILHTQIIGALDQDAPYLQDENGTRFDLLFESMVVGRAMTCEIALDEPNISLKHARITKDGDRCYIQDLKSSNGTFLNDKRVQRKMRLRPGMRVVFADHVFRFYERPL
ncbi:FHA domain-containing protein [Dubosiella muris]|uniref:FHA domain-containing protein n=5 Tax=Dubosiella TaxID=1937008 RepID=A0AC61R8A2_9FIRM|nr:FHA domain-containing protein [Dubosiella muris]TGY66239.1 FHA domain-containing protein [Dubosiella muris]